MTTAACRCANNHIFNSRVEEDSPDINCFIVTDEICPECGAEFEVIEVNSDEPDWM